LEGLSRTILAGSLTTDQEAGVLLHVYFQALLRWGLWEEVVSDHGGQFRDNDWIRVNKRLGIHHDMYPKGHPWQNLIESYFGIEARLGEYQWERCKTVEEAQEFHRELIRDYNRLPHWAHHLRQDGKRSPLAVLGDAKGKQVEPADLDPEPDRVLLLFTPGVLAFLGRRDRKVANGRPLRRAAQFRVTTQVTDDSDLVERHIFFSLQE
jgi:hypothetical protein